MTKGRAKSRIEKLRKEIDHHRYLYHVLDRQEISEAALDSLKRELRELEDQFPDLVTPDSPTQRVAGVVLEAFQKVAHDAPVRSLEDAFTMDDLQAWEDRNRRIIPGSFHYYAELKLDGLAIILTYEDGVFVNGATRGDGRVGEDVTQNLRSIQSIPLHLRPVLGKRLPSRIQVRGEVVMSRKAFEKTNQEQESLGLPFYANPRNTAAGAIRQLDPKVAASRDLDCFVFEVITDLGFERHEDVHTFLRAAGFKTSPYNERCATLNEVGAYLKKWETKRTTLPYQTDGVVVVVDDLQQERVLGSAGKADRWMIAYKFPAEQATTVVEDIQVQVGRTGALTPVAHLSSVLIAGSTVSRATLHNIDEIQRLDVRVGDTVIVQKAGDIIPDIVQVLKNLRPKNARAFRMPRRCPVCHAPVVQRAGEVAHYCSNTNCFAIRREAFYHFVSRQAIDIDGLGPKIIDQLMDQGLIRDVADLYTLTVGDLSPLERFAEKSSRNLVSAIRDRKTVELHRWIFAMGIRHVGSETALLLARAFPEALPAAWLAVMQKKSLEELKAVEGIGGIVAESIFQTVRQKDVIALVHKLDAAGLRLTPPEVARHQPLSGMTFVLTGTLEHYRREAASELIVKHGGHVSESVSKKTDYVVVGSHPGSKASRAKKLGVRIITEVELLKLIG
ncbi:MAG: NAD-dependent DNA ligase LigA [Patescibacteria group bacterium]